MASGPDDREHGRAPAPSGVGALAVSAALVAGLLAASGSARAAEPGASVSVGLALVRLDYSERGPAGDLLDRETGWTPAVVATAEAVRGRLRLAGTASASQGDVSYGGRVQSPSPALDALPAVSTSAAGLLAADLEAGALLGERRTVEPYAGVGWRAWDRRIRSTTVISRAGEVVPVSGLDEAYAWWELQAGARWSFLATRGTEWWLDARLLQVVAPRVAVEWGGQRVRLALGSRPGFRLGLAGRVALGSRWFLAAEAHAAGFGFGASEPDPRTGLHEPESETRTVAFQVRAGAEL